MIHGVLGNASLFFMAPSSCHTSGRQEGTEPGIRIGPLCLWPVLGHKFGKESRVIASC
jgi:hypothetical protein